MIHLSVVSPLHIPIALYHHVVCCKYIVSNTKNYFRHNQNTDTMAQLEKSSSSPCAGECTHTPIAHILHCWKSWRLLIQCSICSRIPSQFCSLLFFLWSLHTHKNTHTFLSRSLALRNTVLGEVCKGRSRLSKCDSKLIMDLIWFKVKKHLKRERVCIM